MVKKATRRLRFWAGVPCSVSAATVIALGAPGAIYGQNVAQGTNTVAPVGSPTEGLEEIVVTAQKRTEDVNKVPISISVFDQTSMQQLGVIDIGDIANMSPGVDYSSQGPLNNVAIRGVYSAAGYPTTAIYIDDVPIQLRISSIVGIEGNAQPLVFDLDRVEVLRGPQGTLFGAGAEGGAIRFITPQPSLTEYSGYARAGAGFTDNGAPSYEIGSAFGGPIIQDVLGFRVSAWDQHAGGYINQNSAIPGGYNSNNANWQDNQVLRGALTYAPTESLSLTPSIYYEHRYSNNPSFFDPGSKDYPDAFTFFQSSLAPRYSNVGAGEFVNPNFQRSPNSDQFSLPAMKAVFRLDGVEFTSNTAYLDRRNNFEQDYTNITPTYLDLPWPTTAQPSVAPYVVNQNVITQELRAQNSDPTDRLQWTVGVFYTEARQKTWAAILAPSLPAQLTAAGLSIEDVLGTTVGPGGLAYVGEERDSDTQEAGFTQISYDVTKFLSLSAGVRVAHEIDQYSVSQSGAFEGGATNAFAGRQHETMVDPKYGINFHINDSSLVYVSAAKGDRIGGINPPLLNVVEGCGAALAALGYSSSPPTFKGDSLWSYELGTKDRFLDGRLEIQASAFHIDWSNIQQSIFLPACGGAFTSNVGKARSNGGDVQLKARILKSVTAGLNVSYTNARDATTITSGGTQIVTSGDQIDPYSAPWIIVPNLAYNFPLAQDYAGYVRIDDEYHSKNPGPFAQDQPNNASYQVSYNGGSGFAPNPAYNILNIHVGVTRDQWDVSAYALNAFNSHPVLYNQALLTSPLFGGAFTYRPLTVGFTAAYHWH